MASITTQLSDNSAIIASIEPPLAAELTAIDISDCDETFASREYDGAFGTLPWLPWSTLLWIGAACSVVGMAICLPLGWDLAVVQQAMKDLREGLDPYVAELARLSALGSGRHAYNVYVYPPLTLRFLRLANLIPSVPGHLLCWLVYAAGFGCQLWAGFQLALPSERRILHYALPLVVFFPGFMPNEVILSGNVAIPIYGAILAASVRGWRSNRWGWFYFAVLAGSLFKPPFLVLLAIPLLVGTAQVLTSTATAGVGLLLFAGQRLIWPKEFLEFLRVMQVESVTRYSAGHVDLFGFSAAGVIASRLQAMGKPYGVPSALFFLAYGCVLFATLLYFGWHYRQGRIGRYTWITVVFLGTFLLNPRILLYDALPATVPMFLLTIRGWKDAVGRWIVIAGLTGVAAAFLANQDGLEISLAMWALLISGLVCLCRESQLATVPVFVPFGEPIPEPELEDVML